MSAFAIGEGAKVPILKDRREHSADSQVFFCFCRHVFCLQHYRSSGSFFGIDEAYSRLRPESVGMYQALVAVATPVSRADGPPQLVPCTSV